MSQKPLSSAPRTLLPSPSKKAIEAIRENLEGIFYYPDTNSYELKKALSERYEIEREEIFTGAGGDEIIELIGKLFFKEEMR